MFVVAPPCAASGKSRLLTLRSLQYGVVKKGEHFWKGFFESKSQISAIPPVPYGERFLHFITATIKTQEEVNRERLSGGGGPSSLDIPGRPGGLPTRVSTDRAAADRAERPVARIAEKDGTKEGEKPERTLAVVRSPSAERTNGVAGAILPVVDEAGEAGSTSGRSRDESTVTHKEEKDMLHHM
jgi:1-phosphatidylinositol-4-phosphate 5-kinase